MYIILLILRALARIVVALIILAALAVAFLSSGCRASRDYSAEHATPAVAPKQ